MFHFFAWFRTAAACNLQTAVASIYREFPCPLACARILHADEYPCIPPVRITCLVHMLCTRRTAGCLRTQQYIKRQRRSSGKKCDATVIVIAAPVASARSFFLLRTLPDPATKTTICAPPTPTARHTGKYKIEPIACRQKSLISDRSIRLTYNVLSFPFPHGNAIAGFAP